MACASDFFDHGMDDTLTELSSLSGLALGERKVPITGIVFACDSFDSETKQIAVLLEDGKFITVRITERAWHSTWMSIAGLGKTIEFTGDVTSSIAGTLIVTAGAAPTCLNNKPVHFIRSATPNSDEISCTGMVLEVFKLCIKKKDAKENAPTVVMCRTSTGEIVYVKFFGSLEGRASKLMPDQKIHIAPARYVCSSWKKEGAVDETWSNNLYTNSTTCLQVVSGSANTGGKRDNVASVHALKYNRSGDIVEIKCILLTDVDDGCCFIVDRFEATGDDVPVRVCLSNIKKLDNPESFKKDALVLVLATVTTYEVVRLDCLSITIRERDPDEEKHLTLLPYKKYSPIHLTNTPKSQAKVKVEIGSPADSRNSSQEDSKKGIKRDTNQDSTPTRHTSVIKKQKYDDLPLSVISLNDNVSEERKELIDDGSNS